MVLDPGPYLRRLGLDPADVTPPSPEGLARLQRAHLVAVPFENASVLRGAAIPLDADALVRKLVDLGGGGFCFELNGAFARLLEALGYPVALLPGRFWSDEGLGPPNEHLALRVTLPDGPRLVDVGAGYSFLEPLRLVTGTVQDDPTGSFRIVPAPDEPGALEVEWRHRDGAWRPHYRFEDRPVTMAAFADVCEHLRTSPSSPFTRGWICARALPDGWATLDGDRLVVTRGGERIDRRLDEPALAAALLEWFAIQPAS